MRFTSVLLFLILCLGVSKEAYAQAKKRYNRSGSAVEFKFGLKAGYHISNFTGDDFVAETNSDNISISPSVEYKSLSSFHGGGYMEIKFSESFSLQPELYVGVFGSEMNREADLLNPENNFIVSPGTDPDFKVVVPIEQRLFLIQLPLLAKLPLSSALSVNFGPIISFKQNEDSKYGTVKDSIADFVGFVDPLSPDRYKKFNVGGIFGLMYEHESGFNLSVRYNRNFTNINKNDRLSLLAKEPKNSTSAILMALGYTFNLQEEGRKKVRLSN